MAETDATEGDDAGTEEAPEATPAPRAAKKTPEEAQAEVEARRAATKARMDGSAAKAPSGKATADDPTGRKAARAAAATTKSVPKPSKRTGGVDARAAKSAARSGNPKKAAAAADASRYTAPIPRSQIESPPWVAGVMFALIGVGMVLIFLTYVVWGGRPLTLGIGLVAILGGILTATQLR